MSREGVTEALIIVAAIVIIVGGALYFSEHVSCFNFFGITKGCVTH